MLRKMIFSMIIFVLLLALTACDDTPPPDNLPTGNKDTLQMTATAPVEGNLPRISAAMVRFSWDRPDITAAAGAHIADIATPNERITVQSPAPRRAAIGLFSVDALESPTLDGLPLVSQLPAESSLTIAPDGSATFTYSDAFDPRWHGRQPEWQQLNLEEGSVTVDFLRDDSRPAKVWLSTDKQAATEMLFLLDNENRISFYWSGELRYCFNFGRAVQSLRLSDPSGQQKTTFQAAPGFEIRLSGGGNDWISVWQTDSEGEVQPEIELPETLRGAEKLCVGFGGKPDDFYSAEQFFLTVQLQATDLTGLTDFPQGERTITFTDAADSSHRAILFWDDPDVTVPPAAVEYPSGAPTIENDGKILRLRFPSGVLVEFPLNAAGAPGGISRMMVGQQTVFRAPPGAVWTSPLFLTLLNGDPTPLSADFSWENYRQSFMDGKSWQPRWTRSHQTVGFENAQFSGALVQDDDVILRWTVSTPGGTGQVDWIFSPVQTELTGEALTGLGMRVRVSGLAAAEIVSFTLPLLVSPGDWQIEQFFRVLAEDPFSFQSAPRYPIAKWFGESQSFAFRSGQGRTVVGLFDAPVWATVRLATESGRQMYTFDIPLGAGEERETIPLNWFSAPVGASSRWAAANIWARLYEDIRAGYSDQAGVLNSRPLPTVVWNQPLEENYFPLMENFINTGEYPAAGESWFDWVAQNQLPRAEAAGIKNIIIQPPWESDAEDPNLISSFHAPRDFIVAKLLGGKEGLTRLVTEAHQRGIKVTLWYPSAFSLFSPLHTTHPDWMAWKKSGIPEDGGWGDIIGMDTHTEYRRHAIDALSALHREIPFDGLWMDSWVGLSVLTNYANAQPTPQLDGAIALQQAFTEMGISQLMIEGLGPLGRSDAYGDYESYTGAPNPLPEQVAELERLRGHEYLLYRIGAGTYIDMNIYHRVLASGGLINIANFDEIDALSESDRNWLRQINTDIATVVNRMQYRSLLVKNNRWLGVAWTQDDSADAVLFAFEAPFVQQFDGSTTIEDVTTGTQFTADGQFQTKPYHTYILHNIFDN